MNNYKYIHGSNAEELVQEVENRKVIKKRVVKRKKAKSEPAYKPKVIYNMLLGVVVVGTILTLALLLKTQFAVNDKANEIIQMKKDLVRMKKDNQKLESDIEKSIDMDEVYRIATEELGMIQPTEENIRHISIVDEAYTIQYAVIEAETDTQKINVGEFLGFISEGW